MKAHILLQAVAAAMLALGVGTLDATAGRPGASRGGNGGSSRPATSQSRGNSQPSRQGNAPARSNASARSNSSSRPGAAQPAATPAGNTTQIRPNTRPTPSVSRPASTPAAAPTQRVATPGNQGHNPGNQGHNQGNPGHNQGNPGQGNNHGAVRPGAASQPQQPGQQPGGAVTPTRPGNQNHGNHNTGRPSRPASPQPNPGHNLGHAPGHNPGGGHFGNINHGPHVWGGAPVNGWGWHRPVPPPRWRPAPGLPSVGTFLGLAFGTALNVTLNYLAGNSIAYAPYQNGVVELAGITFLGDYWPEGRLLYTNGRLTGQQFFYTTTYYDPSRYNSVYNQLVAIYGLPVSNSMLAAGLTTTWFGANRGFITLTYEPMMGAGGYTYYYTTLSIGN